MLIYHMLRTFLLSPLFGGWGSYLFVLVEAIVVASLAQRWYDNHKEALGSHTAANLAMWVSVPGWLLVLASIVVWMNVA